MKKTEDTLKFEKYLRSIGGLENGWRASPNRGATPVQYYMFHIFQFFGWEDRTNPFRSRIYSRYFCSIQDGWLPLVQELIEKLIKLGWDKHTTQIKEKFGGLRFYIGSGSPEIYKMIVWAENESYKICETCGSREDVSQTKGWITTLCGVHMKEHEKSKKQ